MNLFFLHLKQTKSSKLYLNSHKVGEQPNGNQAMVLRLGLSPSTSVSALIFPLSRDSYTVDHFRGNWVGVSPPPEIALGPPASPLPSGIVALDKEFKNFV